MNFRDVVFDQIHEFMDSDKDIVVLVNDMDALALNGIKSEYPSRVINAGVAEQNLMSVAAGLALSGKTVFVYGISAHITKRCYEQIMLDICSHTAPVIILGIGSGLSYGGDGPTHHSNNDVSFMRAIPNITIYNPIDGVSAKAITRLAYRAKSPIYIRLDKEDAGDVYDENRGFDVGLSSLAEGKTTIISTGVLVHRALSVSTKLKAEGIDVGVVDFYRIKPYNQAFLTQLLSESETVIVLEEQSCIGGISSIVAEHMVKSGVFPRFKAISLGDEFYFGAATRPYVHELLGLTERQITGLVRAEALSIGARVRRQVPL